jgi:hypothetical protein
LAFFRQNVENQVVQGIRSVHIVDVH